MLRLLALCAFAAVSSASPGVMPAHVTGMLEYISTTAMAVRLEDKREIQIRIPTTMQGLERGQEVGDWVDVSFQTTAATFDKGLNLMLYVELTDMRPLGKPSAAELERALASPTRRFSGNMLEDSRSPTPIEESQETSERASEPFATILRQVDAYLPLLPNFIADEVTTRFSSIQDSSQWTQVDQIQTEVRFDQRREIRTKILRNGEPWPDIYEALPGPKWRAAYIARLRSIFSNRGKVTFVDEGSEALNGYAAIVCSFHAPADTISRWYTREQSFRPAVDGKIWIAKEDGRVLQVEENSMEFPPDFPLSSVSEHIAFDYVQVGSSREALPVASEVVWVERRSGKKSMNKNVYGNYRHFEAVSQVVR